MQLTVLLPLGVLLTAPVNAQSIVPDDQKRCVSDLFTEYKQDNTAEAQAEIEQYYECQRKYRNEGGPLKERQGQYFCYVEYAAGLVSEEEQQTYAGQVTVPDNKKKFFVKVEKNTRDAPGAKAVCANSLAYFGPKMLTDDLLEPATPHGQIREGIAGPCLSNWVLTIRYPSEKGNAWNYYAYEYPSEFTGILPGMWFSLSGKGGDLSFVMSDLYGGGWVLKAGHCERIEPPK